MKVYADKLAADLKGSLRPLYIVSGDEPLLVQEVCDEIRQALKKHCLLYTSPSPRDVEESRMPSSA